MPKTESGWMLWVAGVVFAIELVCIGTMALLYVHFGSYLAQDALQQEFMLVAKSLLINGQFNVYGFPVPDTSLVPVYPYVVAGVFALTHNSYPILLLLLAAFISATSALIYKIGREISLSRGYAVAAGVLFGLSPAVLWLPPSGLGADVLFTFFIALAAYLALRLSARKKLLVHVLLVALVAGLVALTRPVGLYFAILILASIPFLAAQRIPAVRYMLKWWMISGLAFFVMLCPWLIHNQRVAGHFSLSSMYAVDPFYYNIPDYLAYTNHTSEDTERQKLDDWLGDPEYHELISFMYADKIRAFDLQFLRAHLASYGKFHIIKMIPFFLGSGINVAYSTMAEHIPAVPDISFLPRQSDNTASLFYGGNFGAVVRNMARYWPSTLERILWLVLFVASFAAPLLARGRTRIFFILGAALVLAAAVFASPLAQPRYRVPVEPFIWTAALFTLQTLWTKYRSKKPSL